jgi:hypothetical protein
MRRNSEISRQLIRASTTTLAMQNPLIKKLDTMKQGTNDADALQRTLKRTYKLMQIMYPY